MIARHIVATSSSSLPIVREAKDQIEHYTDTLSQIISRDLSNTLLTKIQFQRYVNWLLRLDKSEKVGYLLYFNLYNTDG
jgi:exocyst complex component 8